MSSAGLATWPSQWALVVFGVRRPVTRAVYVGAGVILLALKYALETALVYGSLDRWLAPAEFLSPFFGQRATVLAASPAAVAWGIVALHLPFLWIGLSMSARRAIDAGLKPWWGFLFILPWVQYAVIAVLSILPQKSIAAPRYMGSPFRTKPGTERERAPVPAHSTLFRLLRATLLGCGASLGMLALMLHWFPWQGSFGLLLDNWVLIPVPVGGFVAGAVATRTRALEAEGRQDRFPALRWGCGLLLASPVCVLIAAGVPTDLGIGIAYLFALIMLVGPSCAVLGMALDRRDLDTSEEGVKSPSTFEDPQ